MIILAVYLISVLNSSTQAYDRITTSVSYANRYSKDFKERMDTSMYLVVIGRKTMQELGAQETTISGVTTVDPYTYIEELRKACDKLSNLSTAETNKREIIRLKKTLNTLEDRVQDLQYSVEHNGAYETNMTLMDNNIRILTNIVQTSIQDYIYEETKNFDTARSDLKAQTRHGIHLSIAVGCIAILLSSVLSWLASRSVTRPIHRLCDSLGQVAKGDFTTRTQIEAGDEITVLTDSFNDMTSEIGRLVEDIKTEKKNLRLTESRLLQAQINPHFLYNTLDTIIWLTESKMNKEAVSMVTWLSDFFRTTLSEGKDYISVQDEKSHIESYLKIQQFRYQDIMDYEIDIPAELWDYSIPKLTLQPLAENALYHGIKNKRGKGLIEIRGRKKDSRLYFTVSDNGKGMSEDTLNQLRKRMRGMKVDEDVASFGLKNVFQRVQYYYGDEYGVFFESREDVGTTATVIIEAKKIKPES